MASHYHAFLEMRPKDAPPIHALPAQPAQTESSVRLAAETSQPVESGKREFLATIALTVMVWVTWIGSLGAPFVFDDIPRIARADPTSLELWPPSVWLFGTQRPLVQWSLALNHAIGGFDPIGYRAVNVTLHASAAVTLYFIVLSALRILTAREMCVVPKTWENGLAFASASLWALHPVATSVVSYIIQRAELLAVLSTMLAVLCMLRAHESTGKKRWIYAVLVPSCVVLALCAKPTAVVAPCIVLAVDVCITTGSWRRTLALRWPMHLANVLALSMLIFFGVVAGVLGNTGKIAGYGFDVAGTTATDYFLLSMRACGLYARMTVDTSVLAIDRGVDALAPQWMAIVGWTVAWTSMGVCVWALARRRWWGAIVACVVLPLLPTTSVIPVADAAVDHRMYGPLAAIIVGVVCVVAALSVRFGKREVSQQTSKQSVVAALALAVLLMFELRANVARQREYEDPIQLWSGAIERSPLHARAYINRAGLLLEQSDQPRGGEADVESGRDRDAVLERAAHDLQRAEQLAPGRPMLLVNQAILDLKRGNATRALERLNTATVRMRADAPTLGARGDALRMLGRYDEAARSYALAAERAPSDAIYPFLEGICHAEVGASETALNQFDRALQCARDPAFCASVRCRQGELLWMLGRRAEAITAFEAAFASDPSHVAAREWLQKANDHAH